MLVSDYIKDDQMPAPLTRMVRGERFITKRKKD